MESNRAPIKMLCFLGLGLLSLPGFGQTVIEGGPFGIQFSNRDGKIDGAAASSNRDVVISPPADLNSPTPGFGYASTVRNPTVRPTTPRVPVQQPQSPVGMPAIRAVDIHRIQEIRKMEQELEVLKLTKESEIVFPVDRLFGSDRSALSPSGRALLNRVLAYMKLTGNSGVKVTYTYFLPGNRSDADGSEQSLTVADFLTEKSGLSPGWFNVLQPEGLARSTPAYGIPRTDFRPAIKISIARG